MKPYKIFLILTLAIIASACGSSGSSDEPKELFSLWTRDSDGAHFDLSGGALSTPFDIALFFAGGEQCNCTLTFIGTQSSGSMVQNSCAYQFGSGSGDPGCNALNTTATYSNANDQLTMTSSNGTATFH